MDTDWLAQLIDILTPILQVLAGALAVWLSRKVAKSLNVNITAKQREEIEKAVKQGVRFAAEVSRAKAKSGAKLSGRNRELIATNHIKTTLADANIPIPEEGTLGRAITARVFKERKEETTT